MSDHDGEIQLMKICSQQLYVAFNLQLAVAQWRGSADQFCCW